MRTKNKNKQKTANTRTKIKNNQTTMFKVLVGASLILVIGLFTVFAGNFNQSLQNNMQFARANDVAPGPQFPNTGGAIATAGLQKLYSVNGGTFSQNVTASPTDIITVRLVYDNTGQAADPNASVKDSIPAEFDYVGPAINKYMELSEVQLPQSLFSNPSSISIAPSAGYFGVSSSATSGILEMGKKKFIHLGQCRLQDNTPNTGTQRYPDSPFWIYTLPIQRDPNPGTLENLDSIALADNNNTYSIDFSTHCGSTTNPDSFGLVNATTGGQANTINVDILGNRYLHLGQCRLQHQTQFWMYTLPIQRTNSATPGLNGIAVANNSTNQLVDFSTVCGSTTTPDQFGLINATSGGQAKPAVIDMLGNRYIHLAQCRLQHKTKFWTYTLPIQRAGSDPNVYEASDSITLANNSNTQVTNMASHCGDTQNPDANGLVNASTGGQAKPAIIDLLDTNRGKGYIEYKIKPKASIQNGQYGNNGQITGQNFSAVNGGGQNGIRIEGANCNNGAINPPNCNQCPAGQTFNGTNCAVASSSSSSVSSAPLDTDGDGIPDNVECNNSATCPDTDGDGVPDFQDLDSDNDGISDSNEKGSSCSSLTSCTPLDTDGDGTPDYRDNDSDGDGVWDLIEGDDANSDGKNDKGITPDNQGRIPGFQDNNGNGLDDRYDPAAVGLNPAMQDTDGDGKKDWLDNDDDDDGIPTRNEDKNNNNNWSDDDSNRNGKPDYLERDQNALQITVQPNPATVDLGGEVRLTAIIVGSITPGSVCEFNMTGPGGQTKTTTAQVQTLGSNTVCITKVPSDLNMQMGVGRVTVRLTSNNQQYTGNGQWEVVANNVDDAPRTGGLQLGILIVIVGTASLAGFYYYSKKPTLKGIGSKIK